MKFSTTVISPVAVVIATLLAASTTVDAATSYNAICVFDKPKCDGSIQLREYTPSAAGTTCKAGDCSAIQTNGMVTSFSALPTCTTDHVKDTDNHLRGKPYVIVESYAANAATGGSGGGGSGGCSGDFTKAVAVVANGNCYPNSAGTASYKVSLGENDLSVTWLQYSDAGCSVNATELRFAASDVDRTKCVQDGTMKVLAVNPKTKAKAPAASSNNNTPANGTAASSVAVTYFAPASAMAAALVGCVAVAFVQ